MENEWDPKSSLCENMFTWPYRRDIEVPNVMALMGNLQGKAVLDFGCGVGNYSRLLKINGAETVVGYDIAEGMIARAKEREEKEDLGIDYTSNLTPDLNGQFDVVISVHVLMYAFNRQDLQNMCSNMARMLRPGGRLVAANVHPDYDVTPNHYDAIGVRFIITDSPRADGEEMAFELCRPPHFDRFKFCHWTAATLETALREAGFCETCWRKLTIYGPCPIEDAPKFVHEFMKKPVIAMLDSFLPE